MQELNIVILAAGKGSRMKSDLPKVLHEIAGKSMLQRVIDTAFKMNPQNVNIIVGHKKEVLMSQINNPVNWVIQEEQLGTADAVKRALPHINQTGKTLILYADVPLIDHATLEKLIEWSTDGIAFLTDELSDPTGYGRVVRENNQVVGIIEEKDATEEQKRIQEINTGIYVLPNCYINQWINSIKNNNAQKEYYLTDVIALAIQEGMSIHTLKVSESYLASGVNDKLQLSRLERIYQSKQVRDLMLDGVTIMDGSRFDLRGTLKHGQDVSIDINVLLEGNNYLGDRVKIGANCVLKNVHIESDSVILPFSHLEDCIVGQDAKIGPYARLRPGAKLADQVHIGNFVEVKKSTIGLGSKVNHLTYIGDANIGLRTNIGAGTITCNYDGVNKHHTMIGDDCRIGSGTMLVAPVKVENKVTIGAGSVITKNCPAGKLTLSRAKQMTIDSWKKPEK